MFGSIGMKIFIVHSLGLHDKVSAYASKLRSEGHELYVPGTDTPQSASAEDILKYNLKGIKWADEVHVIWDGVSSGTLFDMGSAYALDKPIKIIYVKDRTWYSYAKSYQGIYLGSRDEDGLE